MRTYSRDEFMKAAKAWEDYGPEWAEVKRLAANRGMLFPPVGTRHDDREVESPSQRAIVYRALADNPSGLLRIIGQCSSWYEVIGRIIGLEARLREECDWDERDIEFDRKERPTHRDAVMTLSGIIKRIGDSA